MFGGAAGEQKMEEEEERRCGGRKDEIMRTRRKWLLVISYPSPTSVGSFAPGRHLKKQYIPLKTHKITNGNLITEPRPQPRTSRPRRPCARSSLVVVSEVETFKIPLALVSKVISI